MTAIAPPSDREQLRALVDCYALGCDRRDDELFVSCFTPDARLDIFQPFQSQPAAAIVGADALPSAIAPLAQYRATMHLMANHTTEVDGDTATGETYCLANHLRTAGEDGVENFVMVIRYDDRYTRTAHGWRFTYRGVHILWTEIHPASGDPIPW